MTTSVKQTSFSGQRLGFAVVALVLLCAVSSLPRSESSWMKGTWGGFVLFGAAVLLGAYTVAELVRQSRAHRALRREVERLKSEFVSTVSHELRTPLTSIRGSMGLLEGGILGELPPPVLDLVRIARSNTERLIRLINDILDLEKIEAGKLGLRLQPLEAAEVVEATLGSLRSIAEAVGVELRVETQGARPVRADRDRLIQVLTHLISNALKFSPRGGVVTVRAVPTAPGHVRFEVADQGPGIPLEKRSKLFGTFQQLDSSDTRAKGGMGLGLAISQAIVAQHGGRIDVHSEPGHGATFTFSLAAVEAG
jgi:signal transduction histidine kinase